MQKTQTHEIISFVQILNELNETTKVVAQIRNLNIGNIKIQNMNYLEHKFGAH